METLRQFQEPCRPGSLHVVFLSPSGLSLLSNPRQVADLLKGQEAMPQNAKERLRTSLPSRLRQTLLRLVNTLDVSEVGTFKILSVPQGHIHTLVPGSNLEGRACAEQCCWTAAPPVPEWWSVEEVDEAHAKCSRMTLAAAAPSTPKEASWRCKYRWQSMANCFFLLGDGGHECEIRTVAQCGSGQEVATLAANVAPMLEQGSRPTCGALPDRSWGSIARLRGRCL